MRLIFLLLAVLAVVAGIVFGALNGHEAELDLYFRKLSLPLGVALLAFAFFGAIAAGALLWLGVIFPQRRSLNALRRKLVGADTASATDSSAGTLPPP